MCARVSVKYRQGLGGCVARLCVTRDRSALDLLLGSDITVVTALTLAAVDGLDGESGVAHTADHLVAEECLM